MRYVDFHMHTVASEDSDAPIEKMCDAAVKKGLYAIAITDHAEMTKFREGGYDRTVDVSWQTANAMVPLYAGQLRIARGVEIGQALFNLPETEWVLKNYEYDFILASQHKLGDDIDYYDYNYETVNVEDAIRLYFDAVLDTVKWGRFHSLAHLTYPFRYIPKQMRPRDYSLWQDQIDAILRALAEKGLALEINTSGMRNPAIGITHPDLPLVRRFRELGGELITVGADAHTPEDVGAHIAEAYAIAGQAGFRYTAVFFNGKPEMLSIK